MYKPYMNKKLSIIARYNEDISWAEKLDTDVIIYNKGEDFEFEYPHIDIPNIGREGETFIRAIVENYEILDKYEYIALLQGHPFQHCPKAIEIINTYNPDEYILLCELPSKHIVDPYKKIFDLHYLSIEKLFNIDKKYSANIQSYQSQVLGDCMFEIKEMVILCDVLGIDTTAGVESFWATGAQYLIRPEFILSKSKEWWINFHKLIQYVFENEQVEIGYTIERIWPLIWNHKTN